METYFEELLNGTTNKSMTNFDALGNSSHYNNTIPEPSWKDDIKPVVDYLMLIILIVVMLAMGCEVTWMNIWVHIKRPIGLIIGLVSQFILKPLFAYLILLASGISGLHATGVLIIACCPGGVLSNTFTYFCDGDLGLSIAMTTASTVIAMGLMPGNLLLYGRSFESEEVVIPYKEMALSLVSVTSPVIVGMIIKWKLPSVAKKVAKVGSLCGLLIMFICIAIELVLFPNMFDNVPLELYFLSIILPILGLAMGYFLSYLGKQVIPIRKTVAIECGVQNVPVALTIIAMSFPLEMQEEIVLLPWLYGFFMITGCSAMCLCYRLFKRRQQRQEKELKKAKSIALKENGHLEEKEDLMEANGVKIVVKSMKSAELNGNGKNAIDV